MVDEYIIVWVLAISALGSDSSMVDEYASSFVITIRHTRVQIPLWSMNTSENTIRAWSFLGSDSSMVDEYPLSAWYLYVSVMFRFLYGR